MLSSYVVACYQWKTPDYILSWEIETVNKLTDDYCMYTNLLPITL